MPVTVIGGGVVLQAAGYENLIITVTSAGSNEMYRWRMPVPVSMWQPWTASGADADFFNNAAVELHDVRLAIRLCYEQLLVWPSNLSDAPRYRGHNSQCVVDRLNNILPIQQAVSVAWARQFNRLLDDGLQRTSSDAWQRPPALSAHCDFGVLVGKQDSA